jgi:hypothetical protein
LPGPQQLGQQGRLEQKLKDIREQVAQGKLVIKRMTAQERRRYPRARPQHRAARQQTLAMARSFVPPLAHDDAEHEYQALREQAEACTGIRSRDRRIQEI